MMPAAELDATHARLLDSVTAAEPTALMLAKTVLSGFEHDSPTEPALASYTGLLDGSRQRKQAFLDRRAARRAAAAQPAG